MRVWVLVFTLFVVFAVSSCKDKAPDKITEDNYQKDGEPIVIEPISSPDAEKAPAEFKSRQVPGLEIAEPAKIKPDEKIEHSDFWMEDFEAAKKTAADENKDLLVSFSGLSWCPGCVHLEQEIFSKEEFRVEALKNYVPVIFDFPRDVSLAPERLKKAYVEFEHDGSFPTIYLTDPDGRIYAKTSYMPEKPSLYLDHLAEFGKMRSEYVRLMKEAQNVELADVEKAKLVEKAILTINPELLKFFYRDDIKSIVALDKDNEAGLKEKYELTVRMWDVADLFETGKPEDAIQSVDATIEEMKLTGETLQDILFFKSRLLFITQNKDGALKSLNAAFDAAPQSRMAGEIKEVISTYFSD